MVFLIFKKNGKKKKRKKPTLPRALQGDESTRITFPLLPGHKANGPRTEQPRGAAADPLQGLKAPWEPGGGSVSSS